MTEWSRFVTKNVVLVLMVSILVSAGCQTPSAAKSEPRAVHIDLGVVPPKESLYEISYEIRKGRHGIDKEVRLIGLDEKLDIQYHKKVVNGGNHAWSKDGMWLSVGVTGGDLCTLGVTKQHGWNVLPGAKLGYHRASWAPGASELVVQSGNWSHLCIGAVKADGSQLTKLTPPEIRAQFPAWAPNGKWIAFSGRNQVSDKDYGFDIYVIRPDGTGLKNLTKKKGRDNSPAWSPDGKRIAFSSDRDGNTEIYVMNANGTGVKRLTDNPASDHAPSWSPDGKYIAFFSNRGDSWQIHVVTSENPEVVFSTSSRQGKSNPAWRP
jgi:dipeptidyl aminopeptidase/acylaminoacyl peptidase